VFEVVVSGELLESVEGAAAAESNSVGDFTCGKGGVGGLVKNVDYLVI
jgi:hypothetical protein